MTISVNLSVEIDSEWIDTLVDMAGYGIAYWAESADWNGKVLTIRPQSELVGYLDSRYSEMLPVAKVYTLTPYALAFAMADIANGGIANSTITGYARSALLDSENGACDIDSDLADCAIQVACFGHLIFG